MSWKYNWLDSKRNVNEYYLEEIQVLNSCVPAANCTSKSFTTEYLYIERFTEHTNTENSKLERMY